MFGLELKCVNFCVCLIVVDWIFRILGNVLIDECGWDFDYIVEGWFFFLDICFLWWGDFYWCFLGVSVEIGFVSVK